MKDPLVDEIVLAALLVVEAERAVRGSGNVGGLQSQRVEREAARDFRIDLLEAALLKLADRTTSPRKEGA